MPPARVVSTGLAAGLGGASLTATVGFAAGADSVEVIAAFALVLTLALPALDWLVAGGCGSPRRRRGPARRMDSGSGVMTPAYA